MKKSRGCGMGLFISGLISCSLCKSHKIEVKSEDSKGSIFKFYVDNYSENASGLTVE